jgi:hypothetical protein
MRITKKKLAGVVATAAVVALGSTAAFAYWSASGDGAGDANVGSAADISVDFDFGSQTLYPGGTITLSGATSHNTNAYPVSIESVTSLGLTGFASGCNSSDFHVLVDGVPTTSLTFPLAVTPAVSVAPGDHAFNFAGHTLTIHMDNTTSNQDACQGNTLSLGAHFAAA